MNVLLITPDHGNQINNFPWGALSIGSYIKQKGKNVRILDASIYSQKEFEDILEEDIKWADIVGISFFSTDALFVTDITGFIKSRMPSLRIICGGPHAVLEPETTCRHSDIDFVSYGEGERTLDLLISELERASPNFDNVPGLVYKDADKLVRTSVPQPVNFYDTNYELLSEDVQNTFQDYIQILTGRGCSFRCTFCFNSVTKQFFRPRPADMIINEVDGIVKKHDPKVVYFRDENFFQDRKRIYEFVELYKKNNYTFKWRATCRANYFSDNYINDDMIKTLEEINCQTLKFGLESGNERVLKYIKKGITVTGIKRVVETLSRSSITGNYSLMIGIPTETYNEYIDTLLLAKYIVDLDPDVELIGPQYFRLYPGGHLYNEVISNFSLITSPQSLVDYAETFRNDELGLNRTVDYPWIPRRGKYLAKHAEFLCLLYRMRKKRFLLLPFYLLARFRFAVKWFSQLYEIYIIVLLHKYVRRIRGQIRHFRRTRK